jgi:ankyrin repeat domain-containing protein 50
MKKKLALNCCKWVIYPQRPLTTAELQIALATHAVCNSEADLELDNINVILAACANLLIEEALEVPDASGTSIVRPMHYSLYKFFKHGASEILTGHCLTKINDVFHVHEELSIACLTYLRLSITEGPYPECTAVEPHVQRKAFAWYAARSFDYHLLRSGELSDDLYQRISRFLRHEDWFLATVLQFRALLHLLGCVHWPER